MPNTASPSPVLRLLPAVAGAAAASVAAHLANALAYFVGNGLQSSIIAGVSAYFALSSLLGFVVLLVLGAVGLLRRAVTAAAAGLVAGLVGAFSGTLVHASASGSPLTGDVWRPLVATLDGLNLVFVAAFVVAAATVGRRVARALRARLTASGARTRPHRVALVRAPADDPDAGQITHIERVPVDADRAEEQWDAYVAALTAEGWRVVEVEPAPALPDSVFIEDAVVVFGEHAVVTRPGAESRLAETAGAEAAVAELGLTVHRIEAPGTLDGGDVLRVGSTVYVGRGGRTNGEGIRQLRALLAPLGHRVVAVPLTKALHLKSAVTALPDGTVIGWEAVVDDPRVFPSFLPVPEEGGAHVVVLDEQTVLMAASAPRSAALLEDLGYRVVTVDISEFEKMEGCVTCLSVRVR